ncbi:N-6 DNA methylase [Alloyangia pacifica]|uniref:site-specific DNA-methyltransferase (adenine-specific) n=1 Tax=Alloyangia pacifica TaxID=311180 RepID=A0A1I6WLZ3_9RHOB|nr:N-6 DNA methylase [Alloyangia pacifica]SDI92363.1 N-6 DNA Methylase [Alloyangia pacifica]SFT26997.1 N-6 DNA Methylase [Alloyangia pacifica]
MDLIGIENEAEFFPSGTLSDVLKEELSDITARWVGLEKSAHPIERLSRVATSTIEALRQIRNSSDADRRTELSREMHYALLGALGYAWKREAAFTALTGAPVIPLISRVGDASGRDTLWIIEAPLQDAEDEAADPLGACFAPDQFPADAGEAALFDRTIESILAEGVFELADGPRHVMVLGLSQIVLIDKRKWPARSVLRFDLQEIFTRTDRDTLTVMACLISRETRVPEQGAPISDRLEEEAQRNANAVTTSLKRTVRDAIELLGQEVLTVTGGKNKDVWIDGPELSRECLRYMYRLLFLFYAEANPRLNLLDLKNPIYATGYSLETLRDLESVPLRTTADREGTFLWESLQQTLTLLYTGLDLADEEKGSGLRLPSVKVSLLDPASTPLLNGLMLRNEAIQKVIRLLSLRSTGKSTGRISYAKLGIGQLGAVYETLISFTGVVAKTDLIELKPPKGRSNDAAEDGDDADATDLDDDVEEDLFGDEDADQDEAFRRDKVDPLAPSWFVPRSRIGEFAPEEIVFNGSEALVYPKGTFIYRLAGRDREKSASYYTPEPLARLLVKHALMERCRDLTADELLELKILEPAMGSAAFLVETTNQLADLYLERKQKETGKTIPQDKVVVEKQKVRAYIADRNCFGVDLNPIAVELGAISLWLNSLHASDFSPWFGDQLHSGNSLIGARRASYAPTWLSAKKQTDLWLNAKPDEIGWRKRLPENHVWQWLLPAKDMANFDKDKSIKPFAGDAQDQIKAWRKDGFFKKLEPHEIKLAQKLSRVAEALFNQVADDLAKTRTAANDAITLWPDKVIPGNKGLDFHAKEKLNAHLIGADHATNTLPYKRLKTAMDAWCALWLWPLDKADLLPSRAEFLQGMAMILEGGFTPDGSLAAPSMDEFADPSPDFLDIMEPDAPARDLFKAATKRQDGLFRETNVEALIETFDWLGVAVEVAERERFVHFDLIFADVMKARGGFDVIVGNPPWAKPSWNEGLVLADIDPLYAGLSASDAKKVLPEALPKAPTVRREGRMVSGERAFLHDFVSTRGAMEVTSSEVMNPFAGGGSNNLYRCFIDLSFRLIAPKGYAALIHQDGHLGDPKSGAFRRHWYARIARHFSFVNEMTSKNFSEVAPYTRFSLNIYRGEPGKVGFFQFSNAYAASQVEESFAHDGIGPLPGVRNNFGKIDISGHRTRITFIDENSLSVIRSLTENDDVPLEFAKFVQPYSSGTLDVFREFSKFPRLDDALSSGSGEPSWQIKNMWGETSSQKDGVIKRDTAFHKIEDLVIQGPHFHVGNPLNKTPRSICKKKEDYDNIDFSILPENYRPRANYSPRIERAEYLRLMAGCAWDAGKIHADFFRVALRNMINLNSERSLICALIPPGIAHVHTVESVAFKKNEDLVNFHALSISLPFDFLVKASGREHISVSDVAGFPYLEVDEIAKHRALRLACLTVDYRPIWNEFSQKLKTAPWSSNDPRLSYEAPAEGVDDWKLEIGLRTDFARRLAMIEIDVLVAQALGLSLEQLIEIYRVYFPVLQRKEGKTFYDAQGRIVYISAKGMETVGYLNEKGKTPSQKEWLNILAENPTELTCTAIDDTMPGGPREVTRHFVGPFTQCDRIEDYKRAWAHFERLKSVDAAE